MPDVGFGNLFAVTAIALAAPLLLGFAPKLRVPAVVLEIVAGIAFGPSGLLSVLLFPAATLSLLRTRDRVAVR